MTRPQPAHRQLSLPRPIPKQVRRIAYRLYRRMASFDRGNAGLVNCSMERAFDDRLSVRVGIQHIGPTPTAAAGPMRASQEPNDKHITSVLDSGIALDAELDQRRNCSRRTFIEADIPTKRADPDSGSAKGIPVSSVTEFEQLVASARY